MKVSILVWGLPLHFAAICPPRQSCCSLDLLHLYNLTSGKQTEKRGAEMFLFSGFCFGDGCSAVEKGSWVTKNAIYICGQKEMSTPETTGAVSHFSNLILQQWELKLQLAALDILQDKALQRNSYALVCFHILSLDNHKLQWDQCLRPTQSSL